MAHPVSGGAYSYGRAELSPTAGFAAGALFLFGKTASVAAIALVAGAYLAPGFERWVAVALVLVLSLVNASGIRSTARRQLRDRGDRRGRHRRRRSSSPGRGSTEPAPWVVRRRARSACCRRRA